MTIRTGIRRSWQAGVYSRRDVAGLPGALDILYDHSLLKHWYEFTGVEQDEFIRRVYRELSEHEPLMPDAMARVTRRMTEDDWFGHYRHLDNIGFALDRVAARIRFPNRFDGIIEEIRHNDAELSGAFFSVFPRPGARLKGLFDLLLLSAVPQQINDIDKARVGPRHVGRHGQE